MALKIMVVDDDPQVLEQVSNSLIAEGCQALSFSDPREAIICADSSQLDGAVIDVAMPQMDGFALLRMIRNSTQSSQLPVVLLTSRDDRQTLFRSFRWGATRYLRKPFTSIELIATLKHTLHMAALGQRHCARAPLKVRVDCESENMRFNSQAINVSERGALLNSSWLPAVGSLVNLQFGLPRVISLLTLTSKVVRTTAPSQLEVQFIDVRSNQCRALRDYVGRLERAGY